MLDLLLPGCPCQRSWVSGLCRSEGSRQVITTLQKQPPEPSRPLCGHEGFHSGMIPAPKTTHQLQAQLALAHIRLFSQVVPVSAEILSPGLGQDCRMIRGRGFSGGPQGSPAPLAHPWGCDVGPDPGSGSIPSSQEWFPPEGCHSQCPLDSGCCFTSFSAPTLPPSLFPFCVYNYSPALQDRAVLYAGKMIIKIFD